MSTMPWQEQEQEPRRSDRGWHPVNVGHLVVGVALLGLAVVWALEVTGAVGEAQLRWLLPVPWVLGGVTGLLAAPFSRRRC